MTSPMEVMSRLEHQTNDIMNAMYDSVNNDNFDSVSDYTDRVSGAVDNDYDRNDKDNDDMPNDKDNDDMSMTKTMMICPMTKTMMICPKIKIMTICPINMPMLMRWP